MNWSHALNSINIPTVRSVFRPHRNAHRNPPINAKPNTISGKPRPDPTSCDVECIGALLKSKLEELEKSAADEEQNPECCEVSPPDDFSKSHGKGEQDSEEDRHVSEPRSSLRSPQ